MGASRYTDSSTQCAHLPSPLNCPLRAAPPLVDFTATRLQDTTDEFSRCWPAHSAAWQLTLPGPPHTTCPSLPASSAALSSPTMPLESRMPALSHAPSHPLSVPAGPMLQLRALPSRPRQ